MNNYILAILIAMLGVNNSSSYAQVPFKREGTTFVQTSKEKSKEAPVKTKYTWKDSKGTIYPIYVSKSSGACFVLKTSKKTGKQYRQYMDKEISSQICKEMGIEYKPKTNNKQ